MSDRAVKFGGSRNDLTKSELDNLLISSTEFLKEEPQLVEISSDSVIIVGDTHGDLITSRKALRYEAETYVFLGDYVDRGPQQIENINYLLLTKLEEPDNVFLLRGNHESPLMNVLYGFYHEVLSRYGSEAYDNYLKVFSNMPYAALINGDTFLVHGGLASNLNSLDDVRRLPKCDIIPENPLAFELLWNDPSEKTSIFSPSNRGPGIYLFGRKVVETFMENTGVKLIVRAHEFFPSGFYEYFNGKVLSVFSCRFYPDTNPTGLLLESGKWKVISLL